MAEERNQKRPDGGPELSYKAAQLGAQEVTEAELNAINKYALEPLTADEVFTFSAILCDNAIDRQFEQFSPKALDELRKLFVGRTVIKDHIARADNQVARIYATELVDTGKTLPNGGGAYMQLKAHCYMVRTESNKDLIREIKAGIKKEGSVGFRAASAICSICGTDNAKSYCAHWPGRSYAKDGGPQMCIFRLDGVKDAYEFSLVAVPAQPKAGTCKSYTGVTEYAPEEIPAEDAQAAEKDKAKAAALLLRARLLETKNHNH